MHSYSLIFTHIHSISLIFTHIHSYSLIFTHMHSYSLIFTHIYSSSPDPRHITTLSFLQLNCISCPDGQSAISSLQLHCISCPYIRLSSGEDRLIINCPQCPANFLVPDPANDSSVLQCKCTQVASTSRLLQIIGLVCKKAL